MENQEALLKIIGDLRTRVDTLQGEFARLKGNPVKPSIKKLEPFIYLLKQSEGSLIIPKDFVLTAIRRNNDTDYDTNGGDDITTSNYDKTLLHITIGNEPLMNEPADVSMFPWKYVDMEEPFKLEKDWYIKGGTKIILNGASGLTDLQFALHGYHTENIPTTNIFPFYVALRANYDEDRKTYVVPKGIDLYITRIYNFLRLDTTHFKYYDNSSAISSGSVSLASSNLTYYGNQKLLNEKLSPALWSGSREKAYTLPAPLHCPEGTNIMLEIDTDSSNTHYRWYILVGYKIRRG